MMMEARQEAVLRMSEACRPVCKADIEAAALVMLGCLHDPVCSRPDTQRQQGDVAQDPDAHSMLLYQLVLLHALHTQHFRHTLSAAGLTAGSSSIRVSSTLVHSSLFSVSLLELDVCIR